MRVLVGFERFGVIRDAFIARGHDAWSCDIAGTEAHGPHLQCDIFEAVESNWDLLILHPECTYLAASGLHWNARKIGRFEKTELALILVSRLMKLQAPRMAIENPVGCISSRIRKPDQIIQPWQFGDDASKKTCLWLKNLPPLNPTLVLPGGETRRRANQTSSGQNILGSCVKDRKMKRSKTYPGIAQAMADQWGTL